jgi:hypothetical protein
MQAGPEQEAADTAVACGANAESGVLSAYLYHRVLIVPACPLQLQRCLASLRLSVIGPDMLFLLSHPCQVYRNWCGDCLAAKSSPMPKQVAH